MLDKIRNFIKPETLADLERKLAQLEREESIYHRKQKVKRRIREIQKAREEREFQREKRISDSDGSIIPYCTRCDTNHPRYEKCQSFF